MRRVWWSRIARLLCLRGLDGMGSHAHRRVANVGASPTGSSGVCGRPLRVLAEAHCMARSRLALRMLAARSAPCRKKVAQSAEEACRAPAFAHASASPLPRPHSLPCALHTSTRMQSTLDTHAPRVRASPAMHMLSRGCTFRRRTSVSHLRARGQGWVLEATPLACY